MIDKHDDQNRRNLRIITNIIFKLNLVFAHSKYKKKILVCGKDFFHVKLNLCIILLFLLFFYFT